MKQKLICAILASTLAPLAVLAWDNPLTVAANETYTLPEDKTYDQLIVNEGSVIELNGHNLTITGAFSPSSTADNRAIIKNDATGDAAKMTFTLTQGIGSSEFTKVQFGGNLALEVNASFSASTFVNGVDNTHTGGTILDNTRYGSNNEGNVPRITNANGLGKGSVTFANGATLRAVTPVVTYPWTAIASTGIGCTNQFYMECANSLNAANIPVTVEAGNIFCLRELKDNSGIGSYWNEADYSGVLGTFWIRGKDADNAATHSNIGFYPDMPNGVLMLSGKELRHGGTGGDDHVWKLGGIATPDSITSYSTGAILRRTVGTGGKVTVEVGSANVDTTWYGEFTYDDNSNKDWNIKKVGTGVWTIGGANTYHGTTEIAEGAIRLLKAGEIGSSVSNEKIYFTGGTLVFADVLDHNPMSRFVAETAPLKIGVEKDVTVAGEMSARVSATAGIVKTGDGALEFTNFHALPAPATVSGGSMFVMVNTNYDGAISVAEGATLTLYASGKELSVKTTDPETSVETRTGATVSGAGTLSLDVEAGKNNGWRIMNADFSGFSGTLEFPSTLAMNGAYGITGRYDNWDNHLENTTLRISGDPTADTRVFDSERSSLTVGALQLLHEHAQFRVHNQSNGDEVIFGGKSGSESILNGQFTNKKVNLTKNGADSSLTIGPGFSVVDGSSLAVNAGTLIANTDLSGELNYTLTIAPGVKLAGEGVFGAVDLSVNDVVVPDASTFTDKTAEYGFLTATAFSNISSSSNISSLLATLNANETRGKWKVVPRSNGDGTVTLKCVYGKAGFIVILR